MEEEDKEVEGEDRGWGRGGRSNRNGLVKHVTVVKYYWLTIITVLCVCVSLILSLSIM